MNLYWLMSAFILSIMAVVHSIQGEKLIFRRLHNLDGLPAVRGSAANTKTTLRFTWHVLSVLGIGSAAILYYYAQFAALTSVQIVVVKIFAVTFFASFIVALIGSHGRHASWVGFLIVSALCWLGVS